MNATTSRTVSDAAPAPTVDAFYCEVPSDPCAIVMFGASGDLARRKLMPALFNLARHSCLAPRFSLLGFARTQMSDEDFRRTGDEALAKVKISPGEENKRQEFVKQMQYFSGNYDDPDSFARLAQRLDDLDRVGQL